MKRPNGENRKLFHNHLKNIGTARPGMCSLASKYQHHHRRPQVWFERGRAELQRVLLHVLLHDGLRPARRHTDTVPIPQSKAGGRSEAEFEWCHIIIFMLSFLGRHSSWHPDRTRRASGKGSFLTFLHQKKNWVTKLPKNLICLGLNSHLGRWVVKWRKRKTDIGK